MSDTQIAAIAKTRQRTGTIELRSPVSGYVLARNISPNERFERAVEFYRIANLNQVWILADLFENDAQYVRAGTTARISSPYSQGAPIVAAVSDVLPQFDPATRRMKVRLDAPNAGFALRPEMFVDVEFEISLPDAVTIPVDAVVDAGTRKTVFVDRGNGYFEPRRIETGWRFDDRLEVVKGLMPGERIVVGGNFLLDSESRMKMAAMGIITPEADPVCGMDVDRTKAVTTGRMVAYHGTTYYFCSDVCTKTFKASPAKYATGALTPKLAPARPAAFPTPGVPVRPATTGALELTGAEAPMPPVATGKSIFSVDPVCGADVETTAPSVLKTVYKGRPYYFLSTDCQAEFDRNPDKYAAPAPAETPPKPDAAAAAVTPPAAGAPASNVYPGLRPAPAVAAVRDPVCGMDVDAKDAAAARLKSDYNGRTYYFCFDDCKKKFDREPEKYVK